MTPRWTHTRGSPQQNRHFVLKQKAPTVNEQSKSRKWIAMLAPCFQQNVSHTQSCLRNEKLCECQCASLSEEAGCKFNKT
jgi:hypothetical protein